MTIGRAGKICWSKAARNGCAGAAMPGQDHAPPDSRRRARACTVGVFATSASQSLLADAGMVGAKRGQGRSPRPARQGDGCWRRARGRGADWRRRATPCVTPAFDFHRARDHETDSNYESDRRSLRGWFTSRSCPKLRRACRRIWQIPGANRMRRSGFAASDRHRRDARNPAAIPDNRDARSG